MSESLFDRPRGASAMIELSFRRQAQDNHNLAAALGAGLQGLREEGYVAASVERVRRHLGEQVVAGEPSDWTTDALMQTGLVALGSSDGVPVVLDQELLYFAVDWRMELELAQQVAAMACAPVIGHFEPNQQLPLGDDQRSALRHALNHQLTVVSGGPGTGKTTLVGHLIRVWLERGGDCSRLLIAAPTGRAAARLSAAVAGSVSQSLAPAVTLHRALGWSPSRAGFRFDAANPLDCQLVIIDEVSMADLGLMHALFCALPSNAQVVLLGDKDQLVSVQPGSVMADLCSGLAQSGAGHCVQTLAENFRYGSSSGIAGVAGAIRRGNCDELFRHLDNCSDVMLKPQLAGLDDICAGWLDGTEGLTPGATWNQLLSKRFLCAHRTGPAGVKRINALVFRWLQRNARMPGRFVDDQQPFPGRLFSLLGNHYETGFFNGDQGFVGWTDDNSGGDLIAWVESSDQALKSLSPSRLPPVESAFAMTVHRAQGSEFGEVHCVLPASTSPLLTRELLYTAVTRARKNVVIYADEAAVRKAVATPGSRGSGLAKRLLALCGSAAGSGFDDGSGQVVQQSLF